MEVRIKKNNWYDKLVNPNGHKRLYFGGIQYNSLKEVKQVLKELLLTYNEDEYINKPDYSFILECLCFTDYGYRLTNDLLNIRLASKCSRILCLEYNNGLKRYIHVGKIFTPAIDQYHDNIRKAFFLTAIFDKRPQTYLSCHHSNVPFSQIMNTFLEEKKLEWFEVKIKFDETRRMFTICDPELRKEWASYHDAHATLVWMTKEEHEILHHEEHLKNKRYGCKIRDRNRLRSMPPLSIDGVNLVSPIQKGRQYYIHPRVVQLNTKRLNKNHKHDHI